MKDRLRAETSLDDQGACRRPPWRRATARVPGLLRADGGVMAHLLLPEDGSSHSMDILRDELTTAIKQVPSVFHCPSPKWRFAMQAT